MKTKILVIGLTLIFSLAFLPSSVLASKGNLSHSKSIKSEITYDIPDSGDNAHPSGKDRSVEPGRSLTQGKSKSDPDNNDRGPERNHGKSDKPASFGGVDKADQDGNNGCGNDDDFEDDNEGWCGQKPKKDHDNDNPCDHPCGHDGDDDKDHECKDPKPNGTVTPPTTTPTTPTVLGISTSLPQTGNNAYWSLIGNLALALAVILSGIALNIVVKYRYALIKK